MTKEEAIKKLMDLRASDERILIQIPRSEAMKNEIEALNMAIKSLEQQTSDDCVSRQAVIDMTGLSNWFESSDDYNNFVEELCKLPPVTPTRKVGKWIVKDGREQGYDIAGIKTWYIQIMCNKCGFIETAIEGHTGQYNFCPNCGAGMRGSENE